MVSLGFHHPRNLKFSGFPGFLQPLRNGSGCNTSATACGALSDTELLTGDPVLREIKKWKNIPKQILKKYRNAEGWLDEFAMMSDLKSDFPLHYVVFRQTACHMAHEANVECVFSLAKRVSQPCSKSRTVTELTMMATNTKKRQAHLEGGVGAVIIAAVSNVVWEGAI